MKPALRALIVVVVIGLLTACTTGPRPAWTYTPATPSIAPSGQPSGVPPTAAPGSDDSVLPALTAKADLGPVPAGEVNTAYAPDVPPAASRTNQAIVEVAFDVVEGVQAIGPNGLEYTTWGYRLHGDTTVTTGTPGPIIRARVGDLLRFSLTNTGTMPHNVDFHAVTGQGGGAKDTTVNPGETAVIEARLLYPGMFMYHCAAGDVPQHIAQGMYLPIIVDPRGGWPTKADKEFVLVQSDFYPKGSVSDSTLMEGDWDAMLNGKATYVVFNGKAFQYKDAPLQVEEGDRVRLFVMNAGPNLRSDFHVVGNIFDRVYPGGNPAQVIDGVQTWTVPTGGGAVFELTFKKGQSGAGTYAFVTHAFADASKGAVGLIQVGKAATMAGH